MIPIGYTKEDYIGSIAPYEAIYALRNDPFALNKALEQASADAAEVGFRGVKRAYKAYVATQTRQSDTIYVNNATMFEGQPLELDAGEWEADDSGVTRRTGIGIERACPHPIMPVERLVNIDTGEEKLCLAYSKGKQWRTIIVDKGVLASTNKVTDLAKSGIAVTSRTAGAFVDYISDLENLNYDRIPERKSIGRLGYIPGEGFSPYVDGLVFDGAADFRTMFRAIRSHGDEQQNKEILTECRKMSLAARIVIAASLASPLVAPLGTLPFFVHLWGVDSGTGKTVALMAAASVWGDPAPGNYIKTFNSTTVGQEKTAAFLNHLPVLLDELQLAKDSRGRLAYDPYQLAQGVGRTRGNKTGGVDQTPTWANCFLTTGESPLTSLASGAGAINRVIDIECRAAEQVITDGMRVANTLRKHYGFIGRKFVEKLYAAPESVQEAQTLYKAAFSTLSASDTTEKQAMAAALVYTADRLASIWGIFDGSDELTIAELQSYLATKASVSTGDRGYQYMCDWVARNGHKLRGEADGNIEVLGRVDEKTGVAIIIASAFREAAEEGGFSSAALLSYLKQKNLICVRGNRNTKTARINGTVVECVQMRLMHELEDENVGDFL